MAHGTPIGLADNDQRYGVEGAFLIEAGISSSYHIAKFFGLTGWIQEAKQAEAKPAAAAKAAPARPPAPHLARTIRVKVAEEKAEPKHQQGRGFDLGQIITRALTAAGLMK
jgi:ribosomal protein L13E